MPRVPRPKTPPAWHAKFTAMLPRIKTHCRIAFRDLNPEAREECVQNAVANACCAYARLVQLGKTDVAYPLVLARYGVAQTRDGRRTGTKMNVKDVSSEYCRKQKGIVMERLDRYDSVEDQWEELILEDRKAGPAEIAATHLDFMAWLKSLPAKLRKIAKLLATGEATSAVARKFKVSDGRISQIRRELFDSWRAFVGDVPVPAAAVV